jgi:hypothetical protein
MIFVVHFGEAVVGVFDPSGAFGGSCARAHEEKTTAKRASATRMAQLSLVLSGTAITVEDCTLAGWSLSASEPPLADAS